MAAADNPFVLGATGRGKVTAPNGNQDRFSFHVKKRADGTATGEVRFRRDRGDVFCMTSIQIGGVAAVAIAADIPDPDPENPGHGPFFFMLAIDGGEGANAPA